MKNLGEPYRRRWGRTVEAAWEPIHRMKQSKLRTDISEIRFLRDSGILRGLRRGTGGNEPDYGEFAELVNPCDDRLIVTVEDPSERETASKVLGGILRSLGLVFSTKREEFTAADDRRTWVELRSQPEFKRWKALSPRGGVVRDISVSFDREILTFWNHRGLSLSDEGSHPVVSGLFLGYPLPDIVGYYANGGNQLSTGFVEAEVRMYFAFVRRWAGRLRTAAQSKNHYYRDAPQLVQ